MNEKLIVLSAFISNQMRVIESIYNKIGGIEPDNEDRLVHSAWLLHNLYSVMLTTMTFQGISL
jgi:hypothetical protein